MTAIKAIVFDLGKVVFDLSFNRVFHAWALHSGMPFEEISAKFSFDELFQKFECNRISPEQFRNGIVQKLGMHISDEDFDEGWCDLYLDVYPDVEKLLNDLKSTFRLIALTNTNVIHYKVWPVKYANTLSHFEKVFSSHQIGLRKPDREVYEFVLKFLDLKPDEVIFLDDNPENIEGAKMLGIKTVLVASPEQLIADLTEFRIVK